MNPGDLPVWRTLAKRAVFSRPPWLTVEEHDIELPGGRVISDWTWVITPHFVNVAIVTNDGRWLCFRQTKYAIEGQSLAPVGGYIEPGEDPLAAAQREVREETGYTAPRWTALGAYPVDGNRGSGVAHLFLAQDAVAIAAPNADDLEEMTPLLLTRAEVAQAVALGQFKVLPWAACMSLALARAEG